MRAPSSAHSTLSRKEWLLLAAGALAWPPVAASTLWRTRRFQRVAQRASGWRHQLVPDGVEVWREDEPLQLIPWEELRKGRWLAHCSYTKASGERLLYAVDLPEEGVALSGYAEDLHPLLEALSEQGASPTLEDGGRTFGSAGWLMTMLWLGTVVLLAMLMLWAVRSASARG